MDRKFTEEDFDSCWPSFKTYFIEVLNEDYKLADAQEDLESLIGSKYDGRVCDPEPPF